MKKHLMVWLTLFIVASGFAQSNHKKTADELPIYKHTIRVSPMSFIDPLQPSITIGSEWHFKKRASVGIDVSTLIPIHFEGRKKWGFIVKPSFKYFIPALNSLGSNFFIEPDLFWKKQLQNENGWLRRGVVNNVPAYYEFKNYTLVKDVVGFNFKIGTQSAIFAKRLMTEIYVGAGVRFITKKIRNEPDETVDTNRGQFFGTNGLFGSRNLDQTYWGLSFPMGIRFSYIIK